MNAWTKSLAALSLLTGPALLTAAAGAAPVTTSPTAALPARPAPRHPARLGRCDSPGIPPLAASHPAQRRRFDNGGD